VLIFDYGFDKRAPLGGGGAAIYGDGGENHQLSGDGELSLCRTHARVAGGDAGVSAARMGGDEEASPAEPMFPKAVVFRPKPRSPGLVDEAALWGSA
jgi:hypothetical protein